MIARMRRVIIFCIMMFALSTTAGAVNEDHFDKVSEYKNIEVRIQTLNSTLDNAHQMAESARNLGIEEESEIILTAKNKYQEAIVELDSLTKQLQTLDAMKDYSALTFNVFQSSGLSITGFDYLLQNTNLNGCGSFFYEMEQTYGVNGLFAMAVARSESGLGSSPMAINKNNYFGMIGCRYDSPREGILAFGKLMNKSFYKGKSIDRIADTYCPPTSDNWAAKNKSFMSSFWDKIEGAE